MAHLADCPLDFKLLASSLRRRSNHDRSLLLGILAGGFRWCTKQVHGDTQESICIHCKASGIGPDHLWVDCPASAPARAKHPGVVALWPTLPLPTRCFGHVSLPDIERKEQATSLANFTEWQADWLDDVRSEPLHDSTAHIFTDGSADPPTDPRRRRAAWACVQAIHPDQPAHSDDDFRCLRSGKVSGGPHTVPRAELMALVEAARYQRHTVVGSDAAYVVNSLSRLTQHNYGITKKNGDLWRLVRIAWGEGRTITAFKVKGHKKIQDCIDENDKRSKFGNDKADTEAKDMRDDPPDLAAARGLTDDMLYDVHSFMVDVMRDVVGDGRSSCRKQSCTRDLSSWGAQFSRRACIQVSRIEHKDVARNPLGVGGGLFFERFRCWFEGLLWGDGLSEGLMGVPCAHCPVPEPLPSRFESSSSCSSSSCSMHAEPSGQGRSPVHGGLSSSQSSSSRRLESSGTCEPRAPTQSKDAVHPLGWSPLQGAACEHATKGLPLYDWTSSSGSQQPQEDCATGQMQGWSPLRSQDGTHEESSSSQRSGSGCSQQQVDEPQEGGGPESHQRLGLRAMSSSRRHCDQPLEGSNTCEPRAPMQNKDAARLQGRSPLLGAACRREVENHPFNDWTGNRGCSQQHLDGDTTGLARGWSPPHCRSGMRSSSCSQRSSGSGSQRNQQTVGPSEAGGSADPTTEAAGRAGQAHGRSPARRHGAARDSSSGRRNQQKDDPQAGLDPGISFVELALAFEADTRTPLPRFKGGKWALESWRERQFNPATPFELAKCMSAIFRVLHGREALPCQFEVVQVRSLASYGYGVNCGRLTGLSMRPKLLQEHHIGLALRAVLHAGGRKAMLKRPLDGCWFGAGPSVLESFLLDADAIPSPSFCPADGLFGHLPNCSAGAFPDVASHLPASGFVQSVPLPESAL